MKETRSFQHLISDHHMLTTIRTRPLSNHPSSGNYCLLWTYAMSKTLPQCVSVLCWVFVKKQCVRLSFSISYLHFQRGAKRGSQRETAYIKLQVTDMLSICYLCFRSRYRLSRVLVEKILNLNLNYKMK